MSKTQFMFLIYVDNARLEELWRLWSQGIFAGDISTWAGLESWGDYQFSFSERKGNSNTWHTFARRDLIAGLVSVAATNRHYADEARLCLSGEEGEYSVSGELVSLVVQYAVLGGHKYGI